MSKQQEHQGAQAPLIPADYYERVYAGVLGKLIGVYLGRPFEGWTHERIMAELGPIEYYVHERLGQPLVITDDDVAGTFTFIRALEDHRTVADLTPAEIGQTWLNYIVEGRAILWWGGNGNSTEHTAWLNLSRGIAAPASGATTTNGLTVAEQIGAQIFIDGWALVAPGQPRLAAQLAQSAARVSHDGAAVHAAMLWAAMEAAAFTCADINQLLDTGLAVIPPDSKITSLIADVRRWCETDADWLTTLARIKADYGYDKYCGNCHVIPNHALMIMAILYAPDDFQRAQKIVNTSGWDTDCNAGNVGCLLGIKLGLAGLEAGPDWRGPIADRMLISSADGGYSINDAVTVSDRLVDLGYRLAGAPAPERCKDGARFHFSLPGSVQGFQARQIQDVALVDVKNVAHNGNRALEIDWQKLVPGQQAIVMTPTFMDTEVPTMRTYELMATPLLYPGQIIKACVQLPDTNDHSVIANLCLRHYGAVGQLVDKCGEQVTLEPGQTQVLEWQVPECDSQPIAEVGIGVMATTKAPGRLVVDYLSWDGEPSMTLRRPTGQSDFWWRAWVNAASVFSKHNMAGFRIAQDRGVGMIIHGTRQWANYSVQADLIVHLGASAGLAARVQGLRRYYAARLGPAASFQLIRVRDDETLVLAEGQYSWQLDGAVPIELTVNESKLVAQAGDVILQATDDSEYALRDGGVGIFVECGAVATDAVHVKPAQRGR